MTIRVGINGFGRIGRNVLRAIYEAGRTDIEVVAINDLGSVEANAHLLRFDSVHGRFPGDVLAGSDCIDIGSGPIRVTAIREPDKLPWGEHGVDVALECTGFFAERAGAERHLANGSRRVLVSAPASGMDRTIVYGVNDHQLTPADRVVSNASCTTNCLAPIAMVLDRSVGITKGFMTTIHSYTGDQPTLDTVHHDLFRARAAALSMIPTSTGAARAVAEVLPALAGRLDGTAIRVPTPNVSAVDLSFLAGRACSAEEINAAIADAAGGDLRGIVEYSTAPLVSVDFNHNPHSSSFAAAQTRVLGGDLVRVLAWYDNEWGFSNRMVDTAVALGRLPEPEVVSLSITEEA